MALHLSLSFFFFPSVISLAVSFSCAMFFLNLNWISYRSLIAKFSNRIFIILLCVRLIANAQHDVSFFHYNFCMIKRINWFYGWGLFFAVKCIKWSSQVLSLSELNICICWESSVWSRIYWLNCVYSTVRSSELVSESLKVLMCFSLKFNATRVNVRARHLPNVVKTMTLRSNVKCNTLQIAVCHFFYENIL